MTVGSISLKVSDGREASSSHLENIKSQHSSTVINGESLNIARSPCLIKRVQSAFLKGLPYLRPVSIAILGLQVNQVIRAIPYLEPIAGVVAVSTGVACFNSLYKESRGERAFRAAVGISAIGGALSLWQSQPSSILMTIAKLGFIALTASALEHRAYQKLSLVKFFKIREIFLISAVYAGAVATIQLQYRNATKIEIVVYTTVLFLLGAIVTQGLFFGVSSKLEKLFHLSPLPKQSHPSLRDLERKIKD